MRLVVAGIRAQARLGVSEAERAHPQPIEIEVELDLAAEPSADTLDATANYAVLEGVVPRVLRDDHVLVERLAGRLADEVVAELGWERLVRVAVSVTKLAPPLELVGARVTARAERSR